MGLKNMKVGLMALLVQYLVFAFSGTTLSVAEIKAMLVRLFEEKGDDPRETIHRFRTWLSCNDDDEREYGVRLSLRQVNQLNSRVKSFKIC